ncbi:hypothetical protein JTB14_024202 [Gonioctena quinquepunctata]|nr:hypothetical protein JTB14_024202 [Gonioctena quinquepunctata]
MILSQGTEKDEVFIVGNKTCITNGSAALAIIKNIADTNPLLDNKAFRLDKPNEAVHKIMDIHNASNFVIPMSIRIDTDANIFLCDGPNPQETLCYLINFGFSGRKNIQKCWKGEIRSKITSYLDSPCEYKNDSTVEDYGMEENGWTHLKIKRTGNIFEVFRGNKMIMEYRDSDQSVFQTLSLSINSESNAGLWKFHEYEYLVSEVETGSLELIGPTQIDINNDGMCISMFVAMCKSCTMQLQILYYSEHHTEPIGEMVVNEETKDENWKEIKILNETINLPNGKIAINVSKKQTDPSYKGPIFWAIDDVRLCENIEYRYIISGQEEFECQKVKIEDGKIIKVERNVTISTPGIRCPDDTFGKYCVPCGLFGNTYCERFAYCEISPLTNQNCHCTAGYQGESCERGIYFSVHLNIIISDLTGINYEETM